MSEIRKRAAEGLKVGSRLRVTRCFTEEDVRRFGEISRDRNPVHYDERWTAAKGLAGRICHGLLVAGMITEIGGQIGWLASAMNFRFKRPVYFGDTIECVLTITDVDEAGRARAEAVYRNQRGEEVLYAELRGILPNAAERRLLARMLEEDDTLPD